MPFTAKSSVLTEYLITLLGQYVVGVEDPVVIGLRRVYYGDQVNIPEVPAVCVEPAVVARSLDGTSLRTDNEFNVSILIYGADIDGVEDAQRTADVTTEALIDVINTDGLTTRYGGTQFGGNVIYGYVQLSEYGYRVKDNKLMRANRLTVYAKSRTNLLEA